MDYILKDIHDLRGTLIVNRGTPIDDELLEKLKNHQITRLEVGTIDMEHFAEPVEKLLASGAVKSQILGELERLENNRYNYCLYVSAVTHILCEWAEFSEEDLKYAANYGMLHRMGFDIVTKYDKEKYRRAAEVADAYADRIRNHGDNPLQAMEQLMRERLTQLELPFLLLLVRKLTTALLGTEIETEDGRAKLIYIPRNDLLRPIVQFGDGTVEVLQLPKT